MPGLTANLDLVTVLDGDNWNAALHALSDNMEIISDRAHVVSKTSAYTALPTDHMILVDATAGPVTITLPTAVGERGREYVIKKIDASANAVTVDPNGAQTIDGAATYVLSTQQATIWIRSDDANWQALVVAASSGVIASGNLAFTGLAQRITGDMTNGTHSNRLFFQNSVANAQTSMGFLPNGTSTASALRLYNNSNADASGIFAILHNGTAVTFSASASGAGTVPTTVAFAGFTGGYSFDAGVTASTTLDVPNGLTTLLRLQCADVSGNYPLRLLDTTNTKTWFMRNANDSLVMANNALTEVFTISSAGAVTITGLTTFNKTNQTWTTANAGTTSIYGQFVNTGGNFYVGIDSSTGGQFGVAYAGTIFRDGAFPIIFATNSTVRMTIGSAGAVFIGDDANAFMTTGVTIKQGGSDNEILAFKSSDVDHGMTSLAESDTYSKFSKADANAGGLLITGFSDDSSQALMLQGIVTTPTTTKASTSGAAVVIRGDAKSGTTADTLGVNGNIVAFRNSYLNTTHIIDSDGDSHQDVGTAWTNFDAENDLALLDATSALLGRDPGGLRKTFTQGFLAENRQKLAAFRVVTFNDDGHHFINWSRFHMLHMGATRWVGDQVAALQAALDDVRERLAAAEARLALTGGQA